MKLTDETNMLTTYSNFSCHQNHDVFEITSLKYQKRFIFSLMGPKIYYDFSSSKFCKTFKNKNDINIFSILLPNFYEIKYKPSNKSRKI
ncbi:hypothetical protein BpHYR1_023908 [Brachionus plicatilis]|uniref:Uncharacterized protein n=1 Tax=Brachionus plicatilis TaxID=10195 RepID=A0A3M7R6F8_BRAPC|nr:hypothetical protein BpHYR1_023908 [Brachionus plicatilis]